MFVSSPNLYVEILPSNVMEEGLAIHSSILTWRIPWKEEPGRLQSIWLQRVAHDWGLTLSFFHIFLVLFSL